jgi:hypothetical protein
MTVDFLALGTSHPHGVFFQGEATPHLTLCSLPSTMLDKHSILALFLGLERVESIPNQQTNKKR